MSNLANGGDPMKPVEFETARLNVWHIGALFVGGVVNAFALGGIYFSMLAADEKAVVAIEEANKRIDEVHLAQEKETQARLDRGKLTDAKFQTLFDRMPQFDLINQQIIRLVEVQGQTMQALEAANKRMDRITESTAQKLDTIISRQADQSADIKVIQSQLEKTQRTRWPVHYLRNK